MFIFALKDIEDDLSVLVLQFGECSVNSSIGG
jgi:hypothetical protein